MMREEYLQHVAVVVRWAHGRPTVRLTDGRELVAAMGSKVRGKLDVSERVHVLLSEDGTAARVVGRLVELPNVRPKASERRRQRVAKEAP